MTCLDPLVAKFGLVRSIEKDAVTSAGELRSTNIGVCFDGASDFVFGFEDVK